VPLKRVIGICSDGASTIMQSVHKGVYTRLAQHDIRVDRDVVIAGMMAWDINRRVDSFHSDRGVFFVHCVCHRLALVLMDGIKGTGSCKQVIPDVCITFLNNLYNYFARSPRRKKGGPKRVHRLGKCSECRAQVAT
jgi:hypothetical protein